MTRTSNEVKYPEHERMAAISDKSHTIGYFLDTMQNQGLHLARWVCGGHYDPREKHDLIDGQIRDLDEWFHGTTKCDKPTLTLALEPIEKVLAVHFDIDLQKIEDEKRAMLAAIREENAQ